MSWLHEARNPRLPSSDDSGDCRSCGRHIDDGCECDPCEVGRCEHKAHCQICSVGLETVEDYCAKCELKTDPLAPFRSLEGTAKLLGYELLP